MTMKFKLDGCDISFIAEAPEDITLKQLLEQCDKIRPHWCACGVRSLTEDEMDLETEIVIGYDSIRKTGDDVSCDIIEIQKTEDNKKDWDAALQNIEFLIPLYAEIPTGAFGLIALLNLRKRYLHGERSDALYEEMMEAE